MCWSQMGGCTREGHSPVGTELPKAEGSMRAPFDTLDTLLNDLVKVQTQTQATVADPGPVQQIPMPASLSKRLG
jgi:hypothetical protein